MKETRIETIQLNDGSGKYYEIEYIDEEGSFRPIRKTTFNSKGMRDGIEQHFVSYSGDLYTEQTFENNKEVGYKAVFDANENKGELIRLVYYGYPKDGPGKYKKGRPQVTYSIKTLPSGEKVFYMIDYYDIRSGSKFAIPMNNVDIISPKLRDFPFINYNVVDWNKPFNEANVDPYHFIFVEYTKNSVKQREKIYFPTIKAKVFIDNEGNRKGLYKNYRWDKKYTFQILEVGFYDDSLIKKFSDYLFT